jgi:membrane protein
MKALREAILRSPVILGRTIKKFFADNAQFLASGIAFDVLLYCIPFSLLFITAMSYVLGGPTQAVVALQDIFQQLLPRTHMIFVENLSVVFENRGLVGSLGFILLFVMSSITFGSVRIALNIVFRVQNPPGFFIGKAKDFIFVLVVTGLIGLMIGLISLLALARGFGGRFATLQALLLPGWALASTILGFFFTFAIFYLLYRFSPAKTLQQPALLVASFTGAGLFEISKLAFVWYVKVAQSNIEPLGVFGGVLFFFVWIYYSCAVFLLSAEVGWIVQQELASGNRPK